MLGFRLNTGSVFSDKNCTYVFRDCFKDFSLAFLSYAVGCVSLAWIVSNLHLIYLWHFVLGVEERCDLLL